MALVSVTTGGCELVELKPYPAAASADRSVHVVPVTDAIDLMNYGDTASAAAANTIATIALSSATDGGGVATNAYKYMVLATPAPIPVTGTSTVIGFLTRSSSGTISDARVGARLRRKVADVVTGVSFA